MKKLLLIASLVFLTINTRVWHDKNADFYRSTTPMTDIDKEEYDYLARMIAGDSLMIICPTIILTWLYERDTTASLCLYDDIADVLKEATNFNESLICATNYEDEE